MKLRITGASHFVPVACGSTLPKVLHVEGFRLKFREDPPD
jgi:hypothetical protein